jgi:hypothetical protein
MRAVAVDEVGRHTAGHEQPARGVRGRLLRLPLTVRRGLLVGGCPTVHVFATPGSGSPRKLVVLQTTPLVKVLPTHEVLAPNMTAMGPWKVLAPFSVAHCDQTDGAEM